MSGRNARAVPRPGSPASCSRADPPPCHQGWHGPTALIAQQPGTLRQTVIVILNRDLGPKPSRARRRPRDMLTGSPRHIPRHARRRAPRRPALRTSALRRPLAVTAPGVALITIALLAALAGCSGS